MRAPALPLLLCGCAWVTPEELADHQRDCECPPDGPAVYPDADGDGWGDDGGRSTCDEGDGWVEVGGDCDDADPGVHPGADETCGGADEDCDGEVDEAGATGGSTWYLDADGDGWGDEAVALSACACPSGYADDAGDCDDARVDVNPDAAETCDDGADNDCDGGPGECRLVGDLSFADADLLVTDVVFGDGLGQALAGGLDLVGDAHADIVLGAPNWLGASGQGGAALIFAGPLDAASLESGDADVVVESATADLEAGWSVAVLQNHAGDGVAWLAVGCGIRDFEFPAAGAIYLFDDLSHPLMALEADAAAAIDDAEEGAALGFALDAADADGDGRADLLAGAPGTGGTGAAFLWSGPISTYAGVGDAAAVFGRPGEGPGSGYDVALVPDLAGDGLAAALVSAPGLGAGAVALFRAPLADAGWNDASAVFEQTGEGTLFGGVAAAGDTDGDGYGDFLLGDPAGGVAWLLLGAADGPRDLDDAAAIVWGSGAVGAALAGIGDFDADGFDDVAIGAPDESSLLEGAGQALVLYGPVSGTLDAAGADLRVQGAAQSAYAGVGLAGAGDPDGDGFDDLLVGAPGAGQVALIRGQGW